jgi:myo-inositol-1(or 4)-monophosphatase
LSAGDDVARIERALARAAAIFREAAPEDRQAGVKPGGDPVTRVEVAVDEALRRELLREGEGWLSEETADTPDRRGRSRVWVVDPLDGTREFVEGLPEWCVSIGLVEDGAPAAGGILNPATGELFLGAGGHGLSYNGRSARTTGRQALEGAVVLASRSEVKRGLWTRFQGASFEVRPMGSVAYKLARVAAGLADATWTLVPKHEWDVAGGAALVLAAGGVVFLPGGSPATFGRDDPLLPGLIAAPEPLGAPLRCLLGQ